ncbi:MAG TPA: hypothetical protein VI112_18000 [Bacteroidia bacterium]|jgi:hypothetical protein
MKQAIRILSLTFLALTSGFVRTQASSPRKTKDTLSCLEISGKVTASDDKGKGMFTVYLSRDNNVLDSMIIGAGKVFKFTLQKNSYYTIRITRKGYVTRSVSINTGLPKGVSTDPLFRFHFDMMLLKEGQVRTKNKEAFDFPIALITYDNKKGWFDYSRKYTALVKKEMSLNGTK